MSISPIAREATTATPLIHPEQQRDCCQSCCWKTLSCCDRILNIWGRCSQTYPARYAGAMFGLPGIAFGAIFLGTGINPLAGGILLGVGILSCCCLVPYLTLRCAEGENVIGDCCRGMFWEYEAPPVPVYFVGSSQV